MDLKIRPVGLKIRPGPYFRQNCMISRNMWYISFLVLKHVQDN